MSVFGSDVRIKICGLTKVDEALACLDAGADRIGLNFHVESPRSVNLARAREIIAAVARPAQIVGVFVNRLADDVTRIAQELDLVAVQLHGDEPLEHLLALDRFWIIRAFRLGSPDDIRAMTDYLEQVRAAGRTPDAVLVDAYVPGRAGGTGSLLAHELLDLIPPLPRLILAGGLTPENVAERAQRVRPWMVDVASGVESSPGRKDLAKVRAFIRAVRSGLHA
jgi:phosphoribosylanthranilate isomerase